MSASKRVAVSLPHEVITHLKSFGNGRLSGGISMASAVLRARQEADPSGHTRLTVLVPPKVADLLIVLGNGNATRGLREILFRASKAGILAPAQPSFVVPQYVPPLTPAEIHQLREMLK